MKGALISYLGAGLLADRPEVPDVMNGSLVLYAAEDTDEVFKWVRLEVVDEDDPVGEWKALTPADAPVDGESYMRKDGEWFQYVAPEIPDIPDVPVLEAPEDGEQYARKDGGWVQITFPEDEVGLTDAPSDGSQYLRKDGAWVVVTIPESGIEEAPEDGLQYARKDAAWVEVAAGVEPPEPIPVVVNAVNIGRTYGNVWTLPWTPTVGNILLQFTRGLDGGYLPAAGWTQLTNFTGYNFHATIFGRIVEEGDTATVTTADRDMSYAAVQFFEIDGRNLPSGGLAELNFGNAEWDSAIGTLAPSEDSVYIIGGASRNTGDPWWNITGTGVVNVAQEVTNYAVNIGGAGAYVEIAEGDSVNIGMSGQNSDTFTQYIRFPILTPALLTNLEAPENGKTYGRKDAEWVEIPVPEGAVFDELTTSYLNGWTDFDGSTAAKRIVRIGRLVTIVMSIKNGDYTLPVVNLPVGWRPDGLVSAIMLEDGELGFCAVGSDGNVNAVFQNGNPSNGAYINMSFVVPES